MDQEPTVDVRRLCVDHTAAEDVEAMFVLPDQAQPCDRHACPHPARWFTYQMRQPASESPSLFDL